MSIVNPGDSGPRVPAVFDDRVIFGYPEPSQPVQQAPPPQKSGGGAVAAAFGMFFIMLIPCAILGWFVYDFNKRFETGESERIGNQLARIAELETANTSKDNRIVELEQMVVRQNNTLAQERELNASFSPSIRALLAERQYRYDDIINLLGDNQQQLPANLRAIPAWDTEGVRILTTHVRALEDYQTRLRARINLPPPPPPPRPDILPAE